MPRGSSASATNKIGSDENFHKWHDVENGKQSRMKQVSEQETEADDCDESKHLLAATGGQQQQPKQHAAPARCQSKSSPTPAPLLESLAGSQPKAERALPAEMLQHQRSASAGNEPNGAAIVLTPASLSAATTPTTAATSGPDATEATAATTTIAQAVSALGQSPERARAQSDHTAYKGPKFWRTLTNNWSTISQPLALLAIFFGIWAIAYVQLPSYAVPHTAIMRIAFLFVGAQLAGILVTFIRLPDMLGMLFFGVLYTNIGLADFAGYQRFEAFLREMALVNIMLLAGLGLDEKAFKRLWLMIMRLTLIPTVAEVIVIAVLANLLLHMPWLWGLLLGLVVTAVSPNVVVTVMLKLKEERLGLNNGIHTLIYAMTTCNDVVAIFMFGVILGVIFSTGTLTEQILQGPIGIGIGVVFGYVYGLMLQFLPSKKANYANGLRFVLTVVGGAVAVMGSKTIGYPSAGALGCVTVAFIAGIGWKRQKDEQPRNAQSCNVPQRLDLLWKFLKPVSFALIGKEINFSVLDGRVVAYGVLLVLLGSLFRLGFAYISTYGGNLSWRERAYITISGFPKATVQAALGPIALDLARSMGADSRNLELASNVLIISVLAIIFTAPLGAILMLRLAPIWLQRSDDDMPGSTTASISTSMEKYRQPSPPPTYHSNRSFSSRSRSQESQSANEMRNSAQNRNATGLEAVAVGVGAAIPLTISTSPSAGETHEARTETPAGDSVADAQPPHRLV